MIGNTGNDIENIRATPRTPAKPKTPIDDNETNADLDITPLDLPAQIYGVIRVVEQPIDAIDSLNTPRGGGYSNNNNNNNNNTNNTNREREQSDMVRSVARTISGPSGLGSSSNNNSNKNVNNTNKGVLGGGIRGKFTHINTHTHISHINNHNT
jgi:hypothetical protein